MYHDGPDLEAHLDRYRPVRHDLLPARAAWPRRTLGFVLLGLLALMHACG